MDYTKGYVVIILLALLLVILSSSPQASPFPGTVYLGSGATMQTSTISVLGNGGVVLGTAKPTSVEAVAGCRFNEYISAEFRGSFGSLPGSTMNGRLIFNERYSLGVYMLPSYPILERVSVFAILGYHFADSTIRYNGRSDAEIPFNIAGYAYGLGTHFSFSKTVDLKYEILSNGSAIVADVGKSPRSLEINKYSVNIGARYKF